MPTFGKSLTPAFWRRLLQALARWRHARRVRLQRRELSLLDQHALRDLGVDRSEFGSFDAEASGAVERTRLRIAAVADAAEPLHELGG